MKRIIVILAIVFATGGCYSLSSEHAEAKGLEIKNIDFTKLKDGKYSGEYTGGMYKWRENKVEVTIKDGKIIEIDLVSATEKKNPSEIYKRIIEKQSLQVDGIAGASLTSRAFIKGVEKALLNSLNKQDGEK